MSLELGGFSLTIPRLPHPALHKGFCTLHIEFWPRELPRLSLVRSRVHHYDFLVRFPRIPFYKSPSVPLFPPLHSFVFPCGFTIPNPRIYPMRSLPVRFLVRSAVASARLAFLSHALVLPSPPPPKTSLCAPARAFACQFPVRTAVRTSSIYPRVASPQSIFLRVFHGALSFAFHGEFPPRPRFIFSGIHFHVHPCVVNQPYSYIHYGFSFTLTRPFSCYCILSYARTI